VHAITESKTCKQSKCAWYSGPRLAPAPPHLATPWVNPGKYEELSQNGFVQHYLILISEK